MTSGPDPDQPQRRIGAVRGFLRLIVEVDESRRWDHRLRAALLLLTLLCCFGLLGYWIPELVQRHTR